MNVFDTKYVDTISNVLMTNSKYFFDTLYISNISKKKTIAAFNYALKLYNF